MYKTILVPLDGSKLAERALPHAESLAGTYGAKLILLSVVEPPALMGRTPADIELFQTTMDTFQSDTEQYLKGRKGAFVEKNIQVEMLMGHGPVVETIVKTAEEHTADLVIIASHGRSGLERVFFGSVAAGVLHRIRVPLLVIRASNP